MTSAKTVAQPLILPKSLQGVSLEFKAERRLTEAELMEFCAKNRHLRAELDKNGKLIVMPPVDFDGGAREGIVYGYLFQWWLLYRRGQVFSPTTRFRLPDGGSLRAADGSWISPERIAEIAPSDKQKCARAMPYFVVEVRSSSDRLSALKRKMADSRMANGVRLARLIEPLQQRAYVYRSDDTVQEIAGFEGSLSGEEVCPGLSLDLSKFLV
jgi:Uma2 family endonuclease